MNSRNFRELIIRPTLKLYGRWSTAAEELLMLTAAVESNLGEYVKQGLHTPDDGLGVALGPFQEEPKTFTWLQTKFSELAGRSSDDLVWDWKLATISCRLRYAVDPEPFPPGTDIESLAKLWKRVYNGNATNGRTWQDAELAYRRLVK